MIKVCDSLMGTGKTSAAIAYMNSHPDDKFVYVTPYLDEADRIKQSCRALHFVEPSGKIPEYGFSKVRHTIELLKQGKNITTTHSAFTNYPIEAASIIKEQGYTLILDESLSMLENSGISGDDLKLAMKGGLLKWKDNMIVRGDEEYHNGAFSNVVRMADNRSIVVVEEAGSDKAYLWVIPPDVMLSFNQVIVMTYMFSGQELALYFGANNIKYQYIGVCHDDSGYHFTDSPNSDADLCRKYGDKIHVLDDRHWNSIGDDYYALSMRWFANKPKEVESLKKKVGGYFNYLHKSTPNKLGLWGTYSDDESCLRGVGYTKTFLAFNARATNNYRDRTVLAYLCNIFVNSRIYNAYGKICATPDHDRFALSIMLQWIWRSAIRDGKDVDLYLPSSRMRSLLERWKNGEFCLGGEMDV